MEKTIITTYPELIRELKKIKKMGFVRTHRKGQTGIGKTLEDLLGIKENNIPGPNAAMIELKSARKGVKSLLTLFTKQPQPKGANSVLLEQFGYPSKRKTGRKSLHTTINAQHFNQIKGRHGFLISIISNGIEIVDSNYKAWGNWDKLTLQNRIDTKLSKLLFIKACKTGSGANEEFHYNEAWLLSGLGYDRFIEKLKQGIILIDIRIGQYPNGNTHDHGTGFRIFPDNLMRCFSHREQVI